ncbi:uncharacterized protein METZ01_LOCUS382750, partial [marine metagenome]
VTIPASDESLGGISVFYLDIID